LSTVLPRLSHNLLSCALMPAPSPYEYAIYEATAGEMRRRKIPVIVEYTINVSRKPLRYRQVDLRIDLPPGVQMWVEIDGPNHKGKRNIERDRELAHLAIRHGAVLLHYPLWRVLHEGFTALLDSIMRGDQNLGHAGEERYKVWDSRYSPYNMTLTKHV
jgi:hypothetical protein